MCFPVYVDLCVYVSDLLIGMRGTSEPVYRVCVILGQWRGVYHIHVCTHTWRTPRGCPFTCLVCVWIHTCGVCLYVPLDPCGLVGRSSFTMHVALSLYLHLNSYTYRSGTAWSHTCIDVVCMSSVRVWIHTCMGLCLGGYGCLCGFRACTNPPPLYTCSGK